MCHRLIIAALLLVGSVALADTWPWHNAVSTPPTSTAPGLCSTEMLNGQIYTLCGVAGGGYLTNVYVFDGQTWTETVGMPAPRAGCGVAVYSNRIYTFGGYDGVAGALTNVYYFNLSSWTQVRGLSVGSVEQMVATVYSNTIYIMGGYLTNVWTFNGTATYTPVAGPPNTFFRNSVAVYSNRIYSMGGLAGDSTTNVFVFNTTNWVGVAGLPVARAWGAAVVANGLLYYIGGNAGGGNSASTNVFAFNGTSWTSVAGLPYAKEALSVGVLSNAIYAIGGQTRAEEIDRVREVYGSGIRFKPQIISISTAGE